MYNTAIILCSGGARNLKWGGDKPFCTRQAINKTINNSNFPNIQKNNNINNTILFVFR